MSSGRNFEDLRLQLAVRGAFEGLCIMASDTGHTNDFRIGNPELALSFTASYIDGQAP